MPNVRKGVGRGTENAGAGRNNDDKRRYQKVDAHGGPPSMFAREEVADSLVEEVGLVEVDLLGGLSVLFAARLEGGRVFRARAGVAEDQLGDGPRVREGEIERDIAAHAEAAHRGGRGAQGPPPRSAAD